jgi:hypothetical protein
MRSCLYYARLQAMQKTYFFVSVFFLLFSRSLKGISNGKSGSCSYNGNAKGKRISITDFVTNT